jgi:DNA-binding transcriptional ArsR family regulator
MSEVLKALAHPTRRAILRLLREREMSAGEIAGHFDLTKPTLSGHFNELRDAGLVEVQRQGTSLIYRLNASVLEEALLALMDGFGFAAGRASAKEPSR